ncbi:hypothetical protein M0802_001517 [Mischocyttarus mexicanus]|nr:hypothetical protein M0802_001517 [Mischocyttarus mexicanus]
MRLVLVLVLGARASAGAAAGIALSYAPRSIVNKAFLKTLTRISETSRVGRRGFGEVEGSVDTSAADRNHDSNQGRRRHARSKIVYGVTRKRFEIATYPRCSSSSCSGRRFTISPAGKLFTVPDAESTGTVKVEPGIPMIYDRLLWFRLILPREKECSRSLKLVLSFY